MRQRPPDTALSRRCLLRLIGGAATLQIPTLALAGFDFFLSEYSATRAELQAEMAKRFPLQQRYAEVFTVTLRDPQLGLDPANNRLGVTALLSIASPLLRPPGVEGLVSVSSALRYDAPARAVRLVGRRQLSCPSGDNYPGRLEAGNDFVVMDGQRAFRAAGASPCCAARRR